MFLKGTLDIWAPCCKIDLLVSPSPNCYGPITANLSTNRFPVWKNIVLTNIVTYFSTAYSRLCGKCQTHGWTLGRGQGLLQGLLAHLHLTINDTKPVYLVILSSPLTSDLTSQINNMLHDKLSLTTMYSSCSHHVYFLHYYICKIDNFTLMSPDVKGDLFNPHKLYYLNTIQNRQQQHIVTFSHQ